MPVRTALLLVLSSVVNAAICVGSFFFAGFATDPQMQDATMRIGYYVMNGIVVAAAAGTVAPWFLVLRQRRGLAIVLAVLPAVLLVLAILAFLTLDSWLRRNF